MRLVLESKLLEFEMALSDNWFCFNGDFYDTNYQEIK